MINIHLNGDIVRCPDVSAAKKRHYELRDRNRICKYGFKEDNCSAWNNSLKNWQEIKLNNCAGRCKLSGSPLCPGNMKQKETGKIAKTYSINNAMYRKMSSAAHDLIKSSRNASLFLTLTLPPFINNIEPDEKTVNKCFSKFVENIRKNYNCTGYVAVRERGETDNRLHYHIVCSMPFVSFNTLNNSWCAAISDICIYSKCALRTTKKTLRIKNPVHIVRYLCKYFSKSKRNPAQSSRIVFISNNLIRNPIKQPDLNLQELLKPYKGIYINQTSDYSTVFRVTNPVSFMKFCNEFLYNAFEEAYNYPLFSKKPCNFNVPGSG